MIHELVIAQYEEVIRLIQPKVGTSQTSQHICTYLVSMKADNALEYIRENRPSINKHSGFYNHPDFKQNGHFSGSWWFPETEAAASSKYPYSASNKQRVQFLKHLIKQLKRELKNVLNNK